MAKKQGYDQAQSKRKNDHGDYGKNANSGQNSPRRAREQNQRKGSNYNAYNKNKGRNRPYTERVKLKTERKSKAEETIDDIKEDIVRIEKEIKLEISEIKILKLGL